MNSRRLIGRLPANLGNAAYRDRGCMGMDGSERNVSSWPGGEQSGPRQSGSGYSEVLRTLDDRFRKCSVMARSRREGSNSCPLPAVIRCSTGTSAASNLNGSVMGGAGEETAS
jgi:hypothetical protein